MRQSEIVEQAVYIGSRYKRRKVLCLTAGYKTATVKFVGIDKHGITADAPQYMTLPAFAVWAQEKANDI